MTFVNLNKAIMMKKEEPNEPYARKNAWSYTAASIYISVDKQDQVTGLSLCLDDWDTGYLAVPYDKIKNEDKKFISKSTLKNCKNDDVFLFFMMGKKIILNKPLPLTRKVRGIRFADDEEIHFILREIVKQYVVEYGITHQDMFYQLVNYTELYGLCCMFDFCGILFELESEGGLYKNYWEKGKVGSYQSKLI